MPNRALYGVRGPGGDRAPRYRSMLKRYVQERSGGQFESPLVDTARPGSRFAKGYWLSPHPRSHCGFYMRRVYGLAARACLRRQAL